MSGSGGQVVGVENSEVGIAGGNGHPCTPHGMALQLLEMGMHPVVLRALGESKQGGGKASGKEPFTRSWGLAVPTKADLARLYREVPCRGVGLRFGPGSGPDGEWMADFEADGPRGQDSLLRLCGGLDPSTTEFTAVRGGHAPYIVDGERLLDLLAQAGAVEGKGHKVGVYKLAAFPDLEIRVGGYKPDGTLKQLQSAIPPTLGTDGQPRRWIRGLEALERLPEAAYEALEALAVGKPVPTANGPIHAPVDGMRVMVTGNGEDVSRAWYRSALDREVAILRETPPGGRNTQLNRTAYMLAGQLHLGYFGEAELVAGLTEAGLEAGLSPDEITRTLRSAIEAGRNAPLPLPDKLERLSANGNHAVPKADDTDLDSLEVPDRWPKSRPEMFHGIAGEIVRLVEPQTESDSVAILVQFLVAATNLIGRGPHFRVGASKHHLNLYTCLVGPTASGRKGSSWDIVLHILGMIDSAWALDRVQGGLVSGEGLIAHVRDPRYELKEIIDKRTRTKSVERVCVDSGVRDKRIMVVETELSRALKAMNRDSNTLSEVLRQGWDHGRLGTMGKLDPSRATDAHVSIIGHVTKEDITKYLTAVDAANGFANRFLWVCSRKSKLLPEGGDLFDVDLEPIRRRLGEVLDFARETPNTWGDPSLPKAKPLVMRRTPEARRLWGLMYEQISAGKPGLVGKILSRAEAQIMRFACTYAVLDCTDCVGLDHLQASLALWDHSENSVRLVFGDAHGESDAEKLMTALRDAPDGLTRTEISVKVFRRHKRSSEIASLLSDVLTQGLAHRKTLPSTGGKPAERWFAGREIAP